jgi:hypothetical protein
MTQDHDEFNWDDAVDCVVQQCVEGVAIYTNPHGDIVIRQERRWDEEEDIFIVIARGNAEAAIAEMQFAISQPANAEPLQLPKPEPLTNAARQRLYRQRHRNEKSNETAELPLRLTNGADHHQELAS